jgi:SAM-dependent methyltransferase
MTPEQMRMEDVLRFVRAGLGGARRILEVGCGRGELARSLAMTGLDVTALDIGLRDVVDAPSVRFVERDFLTFEDRPYDAIVFTASLHHISPLDRAIERAAALVVPGGALIADEFDLDAPDAATLRWYYDTQELLAAAGLYPPDRVDPPIPHADLVERWRDKHRHHEPLHGGEAMLRALAERFALAEVTRGPYLYRYIGRGVSADAAGLRIATHVRDSELAKIAAGEIRAVGLRITATAAP